MHLVDVNMFFAPEGGGVGRYLAEKHAWLGRHTRWRHTIVAPGPETSASDGLRLYRTPLRVRHGYRFPLTHRLWSRRVAALGPDLVESGDPFELAWAALEAAQLRGVPAVGFYHSDIVSTLGLRFGPTAGAIARRYARALYSHFDLVLAPSAYTTARLRDLGVDRALCQPLGVDASVFHPSRRRRDLRERLGLRRSTRLVVFAGRFAREKNIDVLCAMIERLGDPYHLLLIGSGRPPAQQPRVTVLPYERDPCALATLMASCDLFVHAGDRETFGLVALEAMACAVPLVAVEGGAVGELVRPTGIVVGRPDAEALAQGVAALYAAGPEMAGRRARRWVEQHYTWDIVMRALSAHYSRLLGARAARSQEAYAAR